MKKINKAKILSKNYESFLKSLEGKEHPQYDSSKNEYYLDIKMSLLHCQNGLCAYTEKYLCDPKFIDKENWDENKYNLVLTKFDKDSIKGDLEHFDESLKDKKAWLWDNLFIVDTHTNCRVKGRKSIKSILKPDSEDYDPYKYLEFDFETGVFSALSTLSIEEKKDVTYMIQILGLNCHNFERKELLNTFKELKELGSKSEPKEYITAWKMTLKNL